jgi:hypothetical protein
MSRAFTLFTACAVVTALACAQRERAATDQPIAITATDTGYIAPDTLHEGLNHIVFENRGSSIHECMFIRLPDGMNPHDYIDAVKGGYDFPEGAIDCSGPGLTSPLQRVEIWVPLEAGRYLLACWFKGHLEEVEPRTIVVHGAPRVAVTPPQEDATLKLIDFRFELTGKIKLGPQTIRVETVGPSMHEVDCYRLEGGRTVEELRTWYTNHQDGPLHATAMGGVLDSHDLSRVVWLRRDFTVGHYVMWCSMPMIQSGNEADAGAGADVEHWQSGMILEFAVDM